MKQILTDELLQEAARKVQNAMLNSLPVNDSELPEPSKAFEEKMLHLMWRMKRREQHRKFLQYAAAWVLAALVGLSGWLTFDSDAQASVSKWIREFSENKVFYRFFATEDRSQISVDYVPQWIPDGYMMERIETGYATKVILYSNGEKQIIFICNIADSGTEELIMGENFQIKEVRIGDSFGDFYEEASAEESNGLTWIDEEAGVVFSITGYLDEETMVQIAESVIQNKK
ncbi:DUF4367 domain-containing protein [Oscillibacter sp.]|jgi:hypothetical protein|uniref:DUF4367 domain-containing protein n=1 Tax=Oscillibacter sp. TaxID=1945593 RepID=UPI00289F3049|nr:DUF4367 domain-containing protein [Oscillibacter sp.]